MAASVNELPPQPEVFINFRGSELRHGFVSHLVSALENHNINVFIDDLVDRGQPLCSLSERISKSRIALCILSSKYTESSWCLEELRKIMDCVEEGNMVAIPIFYKLAPSNVKHMRGEFGDAFRNLKESDERKKQQWMQALESISRVMGITVHEESSEASAINKIVVYIQGLIQRTFPNCPLDGIVQPPKTQVFINFHADQLRNNFIGYLVDALQKSEVNVFADNYLHLGDDLNELFKKIEDSGIALVVFSSRYTESKWCMEELVKIKELVSQQKLQVIPVFYKVTPTNVKRLEGGFGDNFRGRWEFESDEPKIKRWKEAIEYFSHRFALTFDENSNELEIDFVRNIVKEVLKMQRTISTMGSIQSSR